MSVVYWLSYLLILYSGSLVVKHKQMILLSVSRDGDFSNLVASHWVDSPLGNVFV